MKQITEQLKSRLPLGEQSRRLFHGRGHCFPGYQDLLIDWFSPAVLVSLYSPRSDAWLRQLVDLLRKELTGMTTVLLQERFLPDSPVRPLFGEFPPTLDAVEGDSRFRLRLGQAQNIGFFLDMDGGRQLVRTLAAGKRVLNLFAYTCSFSIAALKGGAAQVVNLDMNKGALELGQFNHQLNRLDLRQGSFLALELFRSIKRLRRYGPYDLVICDPPAAQGRSFKAERDWPKLLRKIPSLLAPGGELVACLNAPHLSSRFVEELVGEICPAWQLEQKFQPGADFPEAEPERGVWVFHYRQLTQ